ncbi:MAG: hypothetical protein WD469_08370 [Paenibacillaceae bacterium]
MDAIEWLKNYLNVHKVANVKDIRECAKGFGIKKRDLKEAKRSLRIITTSDWIKGFGAENWYWSLPDKE